MGEGFFSKIKGVGVGLRPHMPTKVKPYGGLYRFLTHPYSTLTYLYRYLTEP